MQPLSASDFLRISVAVLFGFIILMSFFYGTLVGWFVRRKSDLQKEPTKVIGGLSVLVMALVANNTWIYGISLFIGGLLIASERFMINLAAIFNSDRKNVHKISSNWKEADPEDIKQKQELEAEEKAAVEETQKSEGSEQLQRAESEKNISQVTNQNLSQIKKTEELTFSHIRKLIKDTSNVELVEYVEEIVDNSKRKLHDAIVINKSDSQVRFSIEVRYTERLLPSMLRALVRRTVEKLRSENFTLVVVIVFKEQSMTKSYLNFIKKHLEDEFPRTEIAYYQIIDKKIKPIEEINIEKLLAS